MSPRGSRFPTSTPPWRTSTSYFAVRRATTSSGQPQLDLRRRRAYLGYLGYLAVQERFRGQGVGGRLLDAVEAWAREQGAELISTDTNLRSNVGAVEFYERHGYERQAVILRKPLT